MYIVFEWVVGTGKSTQSKLLKEYIEKNFSKEVLFVREPGGTPIAESIRTLVQATDFWYDMQPLTDAYLYAASRAELLHSTVKPALDEGKIVISDRSYFSSLAIQWVAQWLGLEKVREINSQAVQGIQPDIVLFLDVDVDVGLQRIFDQEWDKFEKKPSDFSHKIYQWYMDLFSFKHTSEVIKKIDASWSIEEVFSKIKEEVWTFMS